MSVILPDIEKITDLSGYYIIKKFHHGWVVGKISTNETQFVSKEHLIRMGYLQNKVESETTTPAISNVIMVPTKKSFNILKKSK